MAKIEGLHDREELRALAGEGRLADHAAAASVPERRRLRAAAWRIVRPLVFQHLTQRLEWQRGHRRCALSPEHLEPECSDRFVDDCTAVMEDLFTGAKVPIMNLEGWLTSRLVRSTVDAHRRRRGERGALQRPRLPGWLATALRHDPWLTRLAREMLVWVGVEATAGVQLWPLTVWTDLRAAQGAATSTRTVAEDVEVVRTAMRLRPQWHQDHVEHPLGRKQAPVMWWHPASGEEQPLLLVSADDLVDGRLLHLAATAVDTIRARAATGEDLTAMVRDVLAVVFTDDIGAGELDRAPGAGPDPIDALIADPAVLDRIVAAVVEILAG